MSEQIASGEFGWPASFQVRRRGVSEVDVLLYVHGVASRSFTFKRGRRGWYSQVERSQVWLHVPDDIRRSIMAAVEAA